MTEQKSKANEQAAYVDWELNLTPSLRIYEVVAFLYLDESIGLPSAVLDKIAKRTVVAMAKEAKDMLTEPTTGFKFMDYEHWPAFKSLTKTLGQAFWRYHAAVVARDLSLRYEANRAFYDLLKGWKEAEKEQLHRTCQLAAQFFDKDWPEYLALSNATTGFQPEEGAEIVRLSDEQDRGDILYLPPAPAPVRNVTAQSDSQ